MQLVIANTFYWCLAILCRTSSASFLTFYCDCISFFRFKFFVVSCVASYISLSSYNAKHNSLGL